MRLKLRREHYVRLYLEVNSVLKNQDAGTKILDEFPRPTCRSVYTVSDKRLRHGGSGYETTPETDEIPWTKLWNEFEAIKTRLTVI